MTSVKNSEAYDEVEDLVDLRSVWFGLRRRAALFVGVTSSIVAAVAAYAVFSTELYTSETSIMIQPKTQVFAYGSEVLGQSAADPTMVDTEVELLRSRAMAIRVYNRLNAPNLVGVTSPAAGEPAEGEDFFGRRLADIAADLADIQTNRSAATEPPGESNTAAPEPAESDGEPGAAEEPPLLAAVQPVVESPLLLNNQSPVRGGTIDSGEIQNLMNNLEIQRISTTFLIKIRHSHPSPQAAADIANAYAEEYILQQLEAQYGELRQANQWIDARLRTLREEVRQADAAAARYRAEQGLIDVTGESFSEKAATGIATELATARTRLASAQSRFDTVQNLIASGASFDAISEIIASPIIAELRTEQVALNRKLAELKVRYGDRHPEVLKTREEYTELTRQLNRERRRIVDSLRAEVNFAQAQVSSLENNFSDARNTLASNNEALVRLMELERDSEATRGVYEALLNRQKELNERDQLANANARIIARAVPSEKPSKPKKPLVLAGGLMLGLLVAGASAFVAESMDTRIRNTQDVRREFGPNAPVVLVPRIQSRLLFRNRRCDDVVRQYVQDEPDSLFAESLRDLKMYLKLAERDLTQAPTIAFTSVFRGEGTTTTAFAFASLLASSGSDVAYIEYPSRASHFFKKSDTRPDFRESETLRLGRAASGGHTDGGTIFAAGEGDDAQVQTMGDRVRDIRNDLVKARSGSEGRELTVADHRMVAGRSVCGVDLMEMDSDSVSFEDFEVSVFDSMVENVRSDFDYVIIDAPSVLAKNEGSVIASAADFTVLVMEWCSTSRGAARAATQRLLDMRATMLSFVVNKVDEKQRFYFRPEDRQFFFRRPY